MMHYRVFGYFKCSITPTYRANGRFSWLKWVHVLVKLTYMLFLVNLSILKDAEKSRRQLWHNIITTKLIF